MPACIILSLLCLWSKVGSKLEIWSFVPQFEHENDLQKFYNLHFFSLRLVWSLNLESSIASCSKCAQFVGDLRFLRFVVKTPLERENALKKALKLPPSGPG